MISTDHERLLRRRARRPPARRGLGVQLSASEERGARAAAAQPEGRTLRLLVHEADRRALPRIQTFRYSNVQNTVPWPRRFSAPRCAEQDPVRFHRGGRLRRAHLPAPARVDAVLVELLADRPVHDEHHDEHGA